jgi:hypothetical protein
MPLLGTEIYEIELELERFCLMRWRRLIDERPNYAHGEPSVE